MRHPCSCSSPRSTLDLARAVLTEDAPCGDVTTVAVIPALGLCTAHLTTTATGVLAGTEVASAVFQAAAEQDRAGPVTVSWARGDGHRVRPGEVLAVVQGPPRAIVRAERPALNFLSHLSGVATLTREFVDAAAPARVLCTRKTTPGLRELERAAVAAGGGRLHRETLSEAVLVKDNHIQIAGSVGEAVRRAATTGMPVEIEVETEQELEQALLAGADRILLDNPTPELVLYAAVRVRDPERLEVSGGITLDTVAAFVEAGARVISVGRLTHSAPALDLSLAVLDVPD